MEELNKSQIVLLTLLVSFVTSLATGIVTVSLMEQGITPVTNTVNQIVERTKEIIVRVPEPSEPIVITETETVVVHQSDLVAAAVTKNKDSSVIIYKIVSNTEAGEVTQDDTQTEEVAEATEESTMTENMAASAVVALGATAEPADTLVFASRAVVLGGGMLVGDASALEADVSYVVLNAGGQRVTVTVQSKSGGVALLQTAVGTPTSLGDVIGLMRGQAVIVLSGTDRLRVTTGIVSDIILNNGSVVAVEIDKVINTPGSMLINIDGELIGMSTGASRTNGGTWFTSSNTIETALHSSDNTDI